MGQETKATGIVCLLAAIVAVVWTYFAYTYPEWFKQWLSPMNYRLWGSWAEPLNLWGGPVVAGLSAVGMGVVCFLFWRIDRKYTKRRAYFR